MYLLVHVEDYWSRPGPDMSCKIHCQDLTLTPLIPSLTCPAFPSLPSFFSLLPYFCAFALLNCVQSLPLGTVLKIACCTNALLISMLLKCNQNKRFIFFKCT